MAIAFESLKTTQPGLFGVRLSGSVGRAEKTRLKEFAAKCLANDKLRVVMDVGELDALGGGGASVLAEFQRDLVAHGGEMVFVGAGEVVRRFLATQFGDLPCRIFPEAPDAEKALAAAAPAPSRPSGPAARQVADSAAPGGDGARPADVAAAEPAPAPAAKRRKVDKSVAKDSSPGDDGDGGRTGSADSGLDDLLGAFAALPDDPAADSETAAASPAESGGSGRAAFPSASAAPTGAGGAARPQFIPLESALAELRGAQDPAALEAPLRDLLHSFDLGGEITFCARRGGDLVSVDGAVAFSADGPLAASLAVAGRPLSLLDFGVEEMPEAETRLLSDLKADLMLPIMRGGALEAAVFIRRGHDRHEYELSETFALALLTKLLDERRAVRDDDGPEEKRAPTTEPEGQGDELRDLPNELRRKVVQMQVLFSISEDFARVRDSARLMDLLCVTVTAQLGVKAVAVLEREGEALVPKICRGIEPDLVPPLRPFSAQMQSWFVEQPLAVPVTELPPLLHRFREPLTRSGFTFVAPLRTRGELLGLLLLGSTLRGSRPDLDLDFLSTLLNQAAIAMDNARMLQQAHEQNIGVIRTLVSLLEQRQQTGSGMTDRVSRLVGEVAREVNFPPEKMRDLIYGTVLRDIGMIPISDLVLRSPRKLTEAEWKQVKAHPETGVELLGPLQLPSTVRDVVLSHHERFNGEGYPRGQQGRAIPISARIVSVVESYVAMVSDLPYRTALSNAEAISILSENWGMRYDPDVVEAFLRVLVREGAGEQAEPVAVGSGSPEEPSR